MNTIWKPVKWKIENTSSKDGAISISQTKLPDQTFVFSIHHGILGGVMMNKKGIWEYPPPFTQGVNYLIKRMAFIKRCRFKTFEAAAKVYEKSLTNKVDNSA